MQRRQLAEGCSSSKYARNCTAPVGARCPCLLCQHQAMPLGQSVPPPPHLDAERQQATRRLLHLFVELAVAQPHTLMHRYDSVIVRKHLHRATQGAIVVERQAGWIKGGRFQAAGGPCCGCCSDPPSVCMLPATRGNCSTHAVHTWAVRARHAPIVSSSCGTSVTPRTNDSPCSSCCSPRCCCGGCCCCGDDGSTADSGRWASKRRWNGGEVKKQ